MTSPSCKPKHAKMERAHCMKNLNVRKPFNVLCKVN